MQWKHVSLLIASLGLAVSAKAGFVNGGFEDGTFNGWTVELGTYSYYNYGQVQIGGGYVNGTATVIGAVADPYSPFDTPFNGNKMARLNSVDEGNWGAARISQTGIMAAGETQVFVNWGAVLDDPGHGVGDQPFFEIKVFVNDVLFGSTFNIAGAGWTPSIGNYSYNSGTYNVTGLNVGDKVKVEMTVADCGQGGHAGWAYLDGIGTVRQPPGNAPDAGSTVALLAAALLGLAAIRRKF